jgi:hypothetical protein
MAMCREFKIVEKGGGSGRGLYYGTILTFPWMIYQKLIHRYNSENCVRAKIEREEDDKRQKGREEEKHRQKKKKT